MRIWFLIGAKIILSIICSIIYVLEYRFNLDLFSFFNDGNTPNFTNQLEIVPYGNSLALVKAPRFFSDLLYNGKSLADIVKRKPSVFLWNGQRNEIEGQVLEELAEAGILVPKRIYTSVGGVLVTRYYPGEETKSVLRDNSRFHDILSKLSYGLWTIHKFGLHGEPTTNNTFVVGNDAYWADLERFLRLQDKTKKAQELRKLISSSAHHSYRRKADVEKVVFESYPSSAVVDLARFIN